MYLSTVNQVIPECDKIRREKETIVVGLEFSISETRSEIILP